MSIKIKTTEDDADLACLGYQEAAADEEGTYYKAGGYPFCEACIQKYIADNFEL